MKSSETPFRAVWERVGALPVDVLVANYHVGRDWVNLVILRAGQRHVYRIPFIPKELPPLVGLRPSRTRGLGITPAIWMPQNSSLVAPIVAHAQDCFLIYVVPHGPLDHYPLHAMPVNPPTLIDLAPVIYLPCLSMMPPTLPVRPRVWRLLVMGNMTNDLPGAEQEAQQVAQLFGTKPYLGKEATLKLLFNKLPGKNLLHIAGHGFFDPSRPLSSGIPFSDGILTVRHVYDLKLQDCIVVLSGCVTGLGDDRSGEGFSSLVGAFFAAGARGLLVSLWSVDDAETAKFMVGMYNRIVYFGSTLATALQYSYIDLRRDAETHHPSSASFYWAPFKLIGHC